MRVMENKKQLVIVPPKSEALQKLNEVLDGIANEEGIEISVIESDLELAQFIGSAGQCLVAFSSAKKCALFLQENRFLLSRFHTKVILFTPKEIPTKVLTKFIKLGLTEALLENAPPKTLLYKVKLLLRSIKASTGEKEDKNHVVKSMLDTHQSTSIKGEINIERPAGSNESEIKKEENEQTELKGEKEDGIVELKNNLKGKNTVPEDVIDTHWKTKRKLDEGSLFDVDYTRRKKEEKNFDDIDQYYHGENKSGPIEIFEQENHYAKKSSEANEDFAGDYLKKKPIEETTLDFIPETKNKPVSITEEEEAGYTLKKIEAHNIFDSNENISAEQ